MIKITAVYSKNVEKFEEAKPLRESVVIENGRQMIATWSYFWNEEIAGEIRSLWVRSA